MSVEWQIVFVDSDNYRKSGDDTKVTSRDMGLEVCNRYNTEVAEQGYVGGFYILEERIV